MTAPTIRELVTPYIGAALDDHPEGSTIEDLADFVIDQACDDERCTEELFRRLHSSEAAKDFVAGLLMAERGRRALERGQ